jgi:hypothetical protein
MHRRSCRGLGHTWGMTEAAVSFAGNLTDQPEVRSTEGGIARFTVEVVAEELGSSLRWATATPDRAID